MKPLNNTYAKIFCHQVLTENFYNRHHLMHSVIIHRFSLCIVICIAVSAKPIFSISISCTTRKVQFSQVFLYIILWKYIIQICMSYHVKLEIGVYKISKNGKSRNHLMSYNHNIIEPLSRETRCHQYYLYKYPEETKRLCYNRAC